MNSSFGPGLVIRGTIIGSLIIAIFGWMISANAAAPVHAAGDPQQQAAQLTAAPADQNQGSQVDMAAAASSNQSQPSQASKQSGKTKTTNNTKNTTAKQNSASQACKVSSSFPDGILQWCSLITDYAEQRALPPDLVAAVMLQESGGDPDAYSKSGAVGLLQVMPRDGLAASFSCGGNPCFASRPSIDELKDPQFNIEYGTGMLANLIDKYGNYRDALAAYGPKDVGYYYADLVLSIFKNYGN